MSVRFKARTVLCHLLFEANICIRTFLTAEKGHHPGSQNKEGYFDIYFVKSRITATGILPICAISGADCPHTLDFELKFFFRGGGEKQFVDRHTEDKQIEPQINVNLFGFLFALLGNRNAVSSIVRLSLRYSCHASACHVLY